MGVKVPATFEDSSGTIARLSGELEFDVPATPGEVLTADNPASTASFQAGGGPVQTGDGTPAGTVTPVSIGAIYLDTTNGGAYVATTADDTGWFAIGGATISAPGVTELGSGTALIIDSTGAGVTTGSGSVAVSASGSSNAVTVTTPAGTGVEVSDDGAGHTTLGFFQKSPVVQPTLTALSTAAEIVSALQSLGLSG